MTIAKVRVQSCKEECVTFIQSRETNFVFKGTETAHWYKKHTTVALTCRNLLCLSFTVVLKIVRYKTVWISFHSITAKMFVLGTKCYLSLSRKKILVRQKSVLRRVYRRNGSKYWKAEDIKRVNFKKLYSSSTIFSMNIWRSAVTSSDK
jgi:hypothetical protein